MSDKKTAIDYRMQQGKGIKTFFKKIVQRLVAFAILPVVEQQNEINRYVDGRLSNIEQYGELADELHKIYDKHKFLVDEEAKKYEKMDVQYVQIKGELRSLAGDKDYLSAFDRYETMIDNLETKVAYLEKKVAELEDKHG